MTRVELLLKLAEAFHAAQDAPIWRTSKSGRHYMIETTTGEIIGGSPFITKACSEAKMKFTEKAWRDNMEKAVRELVGVVCYRVKGMRQIRIKIIPDHANLRMLERRITPKEIKEALQAPVFTDRGNTLMSQVFLKNQIFVAVGENGELKTCIRITKVGKVIWPKK